MNNLNVEVFESKKELGDVAARRAVAVLRQALEERGSARVIIATGNSQNEVNAAFTKNTTLDWSRITAFHMDEYVGLSATHPASFRLWLKTRVADVVHPAAMHYLNGEADDIEAECLRYGNLLKEAPIDLCFVGIGENGHIAFNDPPVADFADPLVVKRVRLDEACRIQQVGEGHFPDYDAVPAEALSITIPTIMACRHLVCCVPDERKAKAVKCSLEGPITTACPGSILREHPSAWLYLDRPSASLLEKP